MQAFTDILWKISVQAGLLAVVVWLVTRLAGKAPARFRYALWVLVLVKFLVPPVLHLPAKFAVWNHPSPASPTVSAVAPIPEVPSSAPVSAPPVESVSPPAPIASVPTPVDRSFKMPDADTIVALLWPVGVLLMGLVLISRTARQYRLLRNSTAADRELLTRLAIAAGMLGVRRLPRLRVISSASTPMLVGLLRPTIVLPSSVVESCSTTDLDAMLLHELAHVKRRDMLVLWLYQLVSMLFFFHPAVWILGRELKRERELACDELVLTRSGIDRADYASGYVSALKLSSGLVAPVSIAMAEPFEVEKHRLSRILHLPLPRFTVGWVILLLLAVAVGIPTFIGCAESTRQSGQSAKTQVKKASEYGTLRVLSVSPNNGDISAFEPIFVGLELTNDTTKLIKTRGGTDLNTRIEVRDDSGRLVGETPVHAYADTLVGGSRPLIPGESVTAFVVLSSVYQFSKPGTYACRIMLLDWPHGITSKPSDLGPVRAEVTVTVKVGPYDEHRLKGLCTRLITPDKRRSGVEHFPRFESMLALWSIRNNAALPTLKWVAENWGHYSYGYPTALAIKQIGTAESDALLKSLISRGGKIGKAASSVAKLPSTSGDGGSGGYFYFVGWEREKSPTATVNRFLYAYRHKQWKEAVSFFNEYFKRQHADELKNWRLFTDPAGKGVQSVLNDPRSKVLRVRKEGKFTYVLVGGVPSDGNAELGCVELQLIGGGGSWQLSDFPGVNDSVSPSASGQDPNQDDYTAMQGPGITVTLKDSDGKVKGPEGIIHDADIRNVVNELKAAGAEVISVNGQRLIAKSAVRAVGPTLVVNDIRCSPPYVIKALGDPNTLQRALRLPHGVAESFTDQSMITIKQSKQLVVPMYTGSRRYTYAKPVGRPSPDDYTAMQGPGITVTLKDSKKIPGVEGIIHDADIRNVVSEIKSAGAEVISVNEQRLTARSAIRNAGPVVQVNDVNVAPPYVIKAIGEPAVLASALTMPRGVVDSFQDRSMIALKQYKQLVVPAYTGSRSYRYSKPVVSPGGQASRDAPRDGQLTRAERSRILSLLNKEMVKDRIIDARWADGGRKVVFALIKPDPAYDIPKSLHVVNSDGSGLRVLWKKDFARFEVHGKTALVWLLPDPWWDTPEPNRMAAFNVGTGRMKLYDKGMVALEPEATSDGVRQQMKWSQDGRSVSLLVHDLPTPGKWRRATLRLP